MRIDGPRVGLRAPESPGFANVLCPTLDLPILNLQPVVQLELLEHAAEIDDGIMTYFL